MVDQPVDERQLCSKCHTFWGTERTKYMCSKCYKDHILTTDTMTKGKLKAGEEEKKRETPGKAKEEEKTIIELPEQKDKKRCWQCRTKVGLLGFPCKCSYVYCSKHRHAEDHSCTYDFMADGRLKLMKESKLIEATKIDKF